MVTYNSRNPAMSPLENYIDVCAIKLPRLPDSFECKREINIKEDKWENSNSVRSILLSFQMSFGRKIHENNFRRFWETAH